MFWNIIHLELAKTFGRRFFWIGLAVLAMFVFIADVALYSLRNSLPPSLDLATTKFLIWPVGLVNSLQNAAPSQVGGFVLIALVGTLMAQEYSWRTLQIWLGHGIPRLQLLAAKCIASLAPILLVVATTLLVGGIVTAIFTYQQQGMLNVHMINWWGLFLCCLSTTYSLLPYIALTFLLAVISRSVVVSVGGGFVFTLVVEPTLGGLFGMLGSTGTLVASYLPRGLAESMFYHGVEASKVPFAQVSQSAHVGITTGPTASISALASFPVALIGVALYTLLFAGIAFWVFQRQDLTN